MTSNIAENLVYMIDQERLSEKIRLLEKMVQKKQTVKSQLGTY